MEDSTVESVCTDLPGNTGGVWNDGDDECR